MNPKTVLFLLLPALCVAADLNPLIDAARGAPPEITADALIRLAGVDSLPRARKIELLEQAFAAGAHAELPFKRHPAVLRQDGPIPFLNRAYGQNLDALSLQLRAVEAVLPLDPAKARALFAQIKPPSPPRLTCKDFMVYDISRFYETMGRIVRTFSAQEQAKGDVFRFLRQYETITSPIQVGPFGKVLAAAPVNDEDFVALVSSFSQALERISGDDRSFTYARTAGPEIQALVEACKRRKVPELPLVESYRTYLVVNLSGARCADNDQMAGGGNGISFGLASGIALDPLSSDYIQFFNQKLRTGSIHRIGEEESTPARLEGRTSDLRTCQDDACQAISKQVRELILNPQGLPYQLAQRSSQEWTTKCDAVLKAVADWKQGAQETAIDHFREKAEAYGLLLNLAPAGKQREAIVRAEIGFLTKNPIAQTNRAEWLLPVNALVGRTTLDPAGMAEIAAELRSSTDPVIALYARLEQAAPRRADEILPLL